MAKAKKKAAETPKKKRAVKAKKLPSSKAGVKKKGPVTKLSSLANDLVAEALLGPELKPSKKPSSSKAGKEEAEENIGDVVEQLVD